MMRKYIFLILFGLASCGNKYLIPREDFTSILYDIYLSKSYFARERILQPVWQDSIPYSKHIINQHGYSIEQFDSTVAWYCTDPQKYNEIYEELLARLGEFEQEVANEPGPPVELWTQAKEYDLPIDGKQNTIPVNIPLVGAGTYVVKANITLYPEDKSLNPHVLFYLWQADSTEVGIRDTIYTMPLIKSRLMTQYSFEKTLTGADQYTHLRGEWLAQDKNLTDTTWAKRAIIEDISILHLPKAN